MEGQRLILNNDTVLEDWVAGYAEGYLWCYGSGMTLAAAAVIFMVPENTQEIVYQYGDMEDIYEGFTACRALSQDADGRISVCLTKEVG